MCFPCVHELSLLAGDRSRFAAMLSLEKWVERGWGQKEGKRSMMAPPMIAVNSMMISIGQERVSK